MALIVYGSGVSPCGRKGRVVLAEKGLDYTLDPVSPFAPPPEFLEISPLKRIPAFRDTDVPEPNHLADSSAICDYLENKFPKPALYPRDPFQRAKALWYEEYADSVLAQAMGRGFFFERVVKKIMRAPVDEELCQKTLSETLPPLFDYLEKEIGGKEWLAGGAFSIADISICTMVVNFEHAGGAVDASRWSKLAAYVARILARPSFKAFIDEERPYVEKMRAR